MEVDELYPGTAVQRLNAVHARVKSLTAADLSGEWESVRKRVLWAGGLRDLSSARPGAGYTGHSFNDWNHCDLTTMLGSVAHEENNGAVKGMCPSRTSSGPGSRSRRSPSSGPAAAGAPA